MPTATHPLDEIREQAARWVDRQFAGSLSEEKLAEFDIWQRADERHEECVRMATASSWAERMRDGELGVPEREAFTRWLLADARNMEEFRLAALLLIKGTICVTPGNRGANEICCSSIDADYLSN